MKFTKKSIIAAVLVGVLLVGGIAGITMAQEGSAGSGQTLIARVAAILGIDQATVESAFAQAQKEMRTEALDSYLKDLVDEGKITQEEADQYREWWNARPEALDKLGPGFGFGGRGGGRHGGGNFMPRAESTQSTTQTTQ